MTYFSGVPAHSQVDECLWNENRSCAWYWSACQAGDLSMQPKGSAQSPQPFYAPYLEKAAGQRKGQSAKTTQLQNTSALSAAGTKECPERN